MIRRFEISSRTNQIVKAMEISATGRSAQTNSVQIVAAAMRVEKAMILRVNAIAANHTLSSRPEVAPHSSPSERISTVLRDSVYAANPHDSRAHARGVDSTWRKAPPLRV